MKSFEEIKGNLEAIKPLLKKRFKIKEIGVFGSYVRGEQRKRSDVDILIEFESNAEITLIDFLALKNFLSEKLGIKVDLIMKSALKPHIGKVILREVVYI